MQLWRAHKLPRFTGTVLCRGISFGSRASAKPLLPEKKGAVHYGLKRDGVPRGAPFLETVCLVRGSARSCALGTISAFEFERRRSVNGTTTTTAVATATTTGDVRGARERGRTARTQSGRARLRSLSAVVSTSPKRSVLLSFAGPRVFLCTPWTRVLLLLEHARRFIAGELNKIQTVLESRL